MKQEPHTYADAMNDWKLKEAERSLMGKFRSNFFHPRYDATLTEKLVGYLVRLVMVAVAGVIVLYIYARIQSKQAGYRGHLAEVFAEHYKGTNAVMGKVTWPIFNNNISFKNFYMDGKPESSFYKLEAKSVGLPLGSQFLSDTWTFPKMTIHELSISLKSGAMGSLDNLPANKSGDEKRGIDASDTLEPSRVVIPKRTTSQVLPASQPGQPTLLTAGFGLRPAVGNIKVNGYQVSQLSLNWGVSSTNQGALADTAATLLPKEDGSDTWVLNCGGGSFSQNWLKGTAVERLQAEIGPQGVSISPGTVLKVGEVGKIFLRGTITAEDNPRVEIDTTLQDVDIREFCPAPFRPFFTATVSGNGRIYGSTNSSSGIKTMLKVNLVKSHRRKMELRVKPTAEEEKILATLDDVPVMKALNISTQDRGFQKMRFLEGSFTMETGEHVLLLKDLDLVSQVARLRGEIRFEELIEVVKDPTPGQPKSLVSYVSSGDLLVGISQALAEKMPSDILTAFAVPQANTDGMVWLKISFKNDRGTSFTSAAGAEIERIIREFWTKKN